MDVRRVSVHGVGKEKIAKTQNSKDTENLTTEHLTRARDAHRDLLYTKISECTYSEANLDKVPPTYVPKKKNVSH